MIKLKWGLTAGTLILFSSMSFAGDSFVGNGGSAGDLELLVAQKQLQKTFYDIQSVNTENSLCTCEPIFEGRSECSPIVELSKSQRMYCSDNLQKMSGRAARMLKQKNIVFRWTKEDIFVRQGKKTSTADAVANSANDTITLNQQRFLALSDTERLFLLAHEIFHLVPTGKDDEYLSDEGSVGPFEGRQGARRLLNAMAAGTVVEAYRNKSLGKYKGVLRRRKSYMNKWLDLTLTPARSSSDVDKSVYAQESFTGLAVSYTKYFGRLGLSGRYTYQSADKSILSTIVSTERHSVYGLGLSYKVFPFKNPMTFAGQSFVSLSAYAEYVNANVKLADGSPAGLTSKDSSLGGSVDLKFHLPLQLCWMHFGAGLRKSELEFSEINLTNDKIQPYFNIGVSHAF